MGIFSNLFKATGSIVVGPGPTSGFAVGSNNRSFNKDTDLVTTAITCEKILAETLSKLPIEIYRTDPEQGKVKYKEHYLYRLIHNYPNSYSTSTSFFTALEKNRNHYGNSFARIIRDKATGKIEALEHLSPKYITAYKLHNGELYFYYDDGDKKEAIANSGVLHFKFLSEDSLFGMNPLAILNFELDNIFQGKTTLNKSYRNNLNIDKVIESNIANFNSPQAKQAVEDLKAEYSGSANTKKTPVLPAGFKLIAAPTSSIQDAQILESINFSKRDIAALYGVPGYMIGMEGSNISIEQMGLNFKVNTIQYIAKLYRQELERKLLTEKDLIEGVSIEFNTDALVEVDYTTKVTGVISQKKAGLMTPNEANRILGNKTFEQGDYHFVQMQDAVPLEKLEEFLPLLMAKNSKISLTGNTKKDEEKQ
jgi:HK97 family phage portal protein